MVEVLLIVAATVLIFLVISPDSHSGTKPR
jgi:hypothetical protein